MSTNLPMVHVSDLDNHDSINDNNYFVLGQGIDAKKVTVAKMKQALGIDDLKTNLERLDSKIIFKDHAILPTVAAGAFKTYTIISDKNVYASANGLSDYTLIGAIVNSGGFSDQWQVTTSIYNNSTLMMQIKSYYTGELTKAVSCYSVWAKL